jgi:hypothetical protein
MPVREKGQERRFAAGTSLSHVPSLTQTAAKLRGFSPTAPGFTAETDSPLEEGGFEPSVPLTVDAVGGSSSSSPRHVKSKNATRASGPAVD